MPSSVYLSSMATNEKRKLIISGGGTGGHIFPAIAIADAFMALSPNNEVHFVGAADRMEMQKVPQAGYNITGLEIAGLQRNLSVKNLAFPFKVAGSVWKSWQIIKSFKPDAAVGVGGYASGPLLFAASLAGVPTVVQEQNSYAGLTNKLLSKRAKKICVAYPDMQKYFPADKLVFTGNPVRKDILQNTHTTEASRTFFGLEPDKPVLLAVGGSLGAKTINEVLAQNINAILAKGWQLLWQTGKSFEQEAKELQQRYSDKSVCIKPFITAMDKAYKAATMCVARAGALTISELALVGLPAVLVPYPYAAEDHQTLNAQSLVSRQAALAVPDSQAGEKLMTTVLQLMNNEEEQKTMQTQLKTFAKPRATQDIVSEIMALCV